MTTCLKWRLSMLIISWFTVAAKCFSPSFVSLQRPKDHRFQRRPRHARKVVPGVRLRRPSSSRSDDSMDDEDDGHPLAKSSFLSHVMLKVPSVDQTAKYWTDKGGRIRTSRPEENATNGNSELLSAFVELGCSKSSRSKAESPSSSSPACFALELVSTTTSTTSTTKSYSIGNAISYIGVSMLLQFQNNLLGAISGQEGVAGQGEEPNGIPVQSAASAPGDLLARFALHSKDLEATGQFYTSILGMTIKAQDDNMLCLRYDNDTSSTSNGVPTTLVFDAWNDDHETLDLGDCFDHIVVVTSAPVEDIYSWLQKERQPGPPKIFMKPTDMFGKTVMGLLDPNGYKVIIAS